MLQGEEGQEILCAVCGRTVRVVQTRHNGFAIAALILGIVSLGAWFIPCCGGPVTIAGIVFGALGLKSQHRTMAIVGIVLCSVGLLGTVLNAAWGAYLGATGQHQLLNALRR
jgi:hypothetical protein